MTRDPSRRIDFTGLSEFLSQFENARGHFFRSQHEFLMAMRAVVDVLTKYSAGRGIDPLEDGGANVLLILRTVIDYLLSKVPADGAEGALDAKLEALRGVREVLDAEERRLSAYSEDELVAAKIDAVRSIGRVIDQEIDRTRAEAKRQRQPRVRKVDID